MERALAPIDEHDGEITQVGPASLARALSSMRSSMRTRDQLDEELEDLLDPQDEATPPRPRPAAREVETLPAPPHSDIRKIGQPDGNPGQDPLAFYIESLRDADPVERAGAPDSSPPTPRPRRETVKMTPGLLPPRMIDHRQQTLPLIDRPPRPEPPSPSPRMASPASVRSAVVRRATLTPPAERAGRFGKIIVVGLAAGIALTLLLVLLGHLLHGVSP
jgi:hypothetical protein